MRKISCLLLCLLLALTGSAALAETDLGAMDTATGEVEAVRTFDITAPYSGVLLPFDLELGDRVKLGDALFELDTAKVYAPCDGTLGALFAAVGDDADAVTRRYGGIAAVEPKENLILDCTTTGAYDEAENKLLHVGELLYYKNASGDKANGTGRVTAVSPSGYQVEILSGTPEVKQSVNLYRDSFYTRESNVGKGTCAPASPVSVPGSGRVLRVHAAEGQSVKAGDLLFELAAADAAPDALSAKVPSSASGVISALAAASGQQVYKGQLLCTVSDESALQVTADVDEMDLGSLTVGDSVPVVFDRFPETVYQGTVTSISALGTVKQNASYYTVKLSVGGANLLLGMSATVYLTK